MPSFKKKMTISTYYRASIECSACDEVRNNGDLDIDEDPSRTPSEARQALLRDLTEVGWRFSRRGDNAPLCPDCYSEEAKEIEEEDEAEDGVHHDEYDEDEDTGEDCDEDDG
jgi:hypothetical protein